MIAGIVATIGRLINIKNHALNANLGGYDH